MLRVALSMPLLAALASAAPQALPPNADAIRAEFGGKIIVTPDADGREKWNSPADTVPKISTTDVVRAGQTVYILTFVVNPGVDDNGAAHVICHVTAKRPDGTTSIDQADIPCLGKLALDPQHVFLTSAAIGFTAEPNDLRGEWSIAVDVTDRVQNKTLPLRRTFTVTD